MANLSARIAKLEQSAGIGEQAARPVIMLADFYNEGTNKAVERWITENEAAPDNAFFIVLVSL